MGDRVWYVTAARTPINWATAFDADGVAQVDVYRLLDLPGTSNDRLTQWVVAGRTIDPRVIEKAKFGASTDPVPAPYSPPAQPPSDIDRLRTDIAEQSAATDSAVTALDGATVKLAGHQNVPGGKTFTGGTQDVHVGRGAPYSEVHTNGSGAFYGGLIAGSDGGKRGPVGVNVIINGSMLSAEGLTDKVGLALTTNLRGGFAGEPGYGAINPSFAFGANDYLTAGRSNVAGDLVGLDTIFGRLTEAHVESTDASINTLVGLMVETSSNSPADTAIGVKIVGHRHGGTGSAGVVATAVGLEVSSPTQGTTKYALRTTGDAMAQFGGDVHLTVDPSAPKLLHLYAGELRSRKVSIGGEAVTALSGVNVPSVAMLTAKSNGDADVVAHLQGRGAQSGDLLRMGRDSVVSTRFDFDARLIQANAEAPADASLNNGEVATYIDATFGSMKIKYKAKDVLGRLYNVSFPIDPLGSTPAAATDLASVIALANDLRAKFVGLGWIA